MSMPTPGTWRVQGACLEGAQVVVLNEATGRGAVFVDQELNGRYAVELEGELCDVVIISQTVSTESSGQTRIVLRNVTDGVEVDPAECSP